MYPAPLASRGATGEKRHEARYWLSQLEMRHTFFFSIYIISNWDSHICVHYCTHLCHISLVALCHASAVLAVAFKCI